MDTFDPAKHFTPLYNLSDCLELSKTSGLYLKPIAKLNITVTLPSIGSGKTVFHQEIIDSLGAAIRPEKFIKIRLSKRTAEFLRFDAELESRRTISSIISKIHCKGLKSSTCDELLEIKATEAKLDFPTQHDWDSYFKKTKGMDMEVPGLRPDTVYLQNLPCAWFAHFNDVEMRPSAYVLRKVFQNFGEIRAVDVPCLDPLRKQMTPAISGLFNTHNPDQKIFFDAFIQYEEYVGFAKCMAALRGKHLALIHPSSSWFSPIKVTFDKSMHLSDDSLYRRDSERQVLQCQQKEEEDRIRLEQQMEKQNADQHKEREEKEKAEKKKNRKDEDDPYVSRVKNQLRFIEAKENAYKNPEEYETKILLEERKMIITQRKLESIRLLNALFDRIKNYHKKEVLALRAIERVKEEEKNKSSESDNGSSSSSSTSSSSSDDRRKKEIKTKKEPSEESLDKGWCTTDLREYIEMVKYYKVHSQKNQTEMSHMQYLSAKKHYYNLEKKAKKEFVDSYVSRRVEESGPRVDSRKVKELKNKLNKLLMLQSRKKSGQIRHKIEILKKQCAKFQLLESSSNPLVSDMSSDSDASERINSSSEESKDDDEDQKDDAGAGVYKGDQKLYNFSLNDLMDEFRFKTKHPDIVSSASGRGSYGHNPQASFGVGGYSQVAGQQPQFPTNQPPPFQPSYGDVWGHAQNYNLWRGVGNNFYGQQRPGNNFNLYNRGGWGGSYKQNFFEHDIRSSGGGFGPPGGYENHRAGGLNYHNYRNQNSFDFRKDREDVMKNMQERHLARWKKNEEKQHPEQDYGKRLDKRPHSEGSSGDDRRHPRKSLKEDYGVEGEKWKSRYSLEEDKFKDVAKSYKSKIKEREEFHQKVSNVSSSHRPERRYRGRVESDDDPVSNSGVKKSDERNSQHDDGISTQKKVGADKKRKKRDSSDDEHNESRRRKEKKQSLSSKSREKEDYRNRHTAKEKRTRNDEKGSEGRDSDSDAITNDETKLRKFLMNKVSRQSTGGGGKTSEKEGKRERRDKTPKSSEAEIDTDSSDDSDTDIDKQTFAEFLLREERLKQQMDDLDTRYREEAKRLSTIDSVRGSPFKQRMYRLKRNRYWE